MENIKLVVVGDDGVGKTCLLITFAQGVFPTDYVPTVFDNHNAKVVFENKVVNLGLWDTTSVNEEYERLRPLSYPETSVYMICYAVDDPVSLLHVKKWYEEICMHDPSKPIFLVGNKLDLKKEISETERIEQFEKVIEMLESKEKAKIEEEERNKEKEKDNEEEERKEAEKKKEEDRKEKSSKKKKKGWFSGLFGGGSKKKKTEKKKSGNVVIDSSPFFKDPSLSGCDIAKKLELAGHLECSAKENRKVREIFDFACGVVISSTRVATK